MTGTYSPVAYDRTQCDWLVQFGSERLNGRRPEINYRTPNTNEIYYTDVLTTMDTIVKQRSHGRCTAVSTYAWELRDRKPYLQIIRKWTARILPSHENPRPLGLAKAVHRRTSNWTTTVHVLRNSKYKQRAPATRTDTSAVRYAVALRLARERGDCDITLALLRNFY